MNGNAMTDKLIKICEKYILPASALAVVKEPYIPFLPKYWNGVLILAESQDLSKKNASYVEWLNGLSASDRIKRLNLRNDSVGIQPWDDGTLKLAVEAALKIKASEVAVSNAVLWSQRVANDKNDNPDEKLQDLSSEIWKELLPILNPTLLVCCGKIAKGVIDSTGWTGKILNLRLPSQNAMSRVVGMFDEENMLSRYPEVNAVALKHPDWVGNTYRLNKISFACHAVIIAITKRVKRLKFKKRIVGGKKELVRCPQCDYVIRKDHLEKHLRKVHALHTNYSPKESLWVEKKCSRCAEIIYIRRDWKKPKLLCRKCMEKRKARIIANIMKGGRKTAKGIYSKALYSCLSGRPMQGGSPGLGKRR